MPDWTRRETMSAIAAGPLALSLQSARAAKAQAAHPTLWYRQPAAKWTEALPVGNGRIGAMVFGGTDRERLQFNEATLWAGGPYDPVNPKAREALPRVRELVFADKIAEAEALTNEALLGTPKTQMPYQAFGNLVILFPGLTEANDYSRALDLDSAVATTRFLADSVEHVRRVVASTPDQVIAVRIEASARGRVDADFALESEHADAIARPFGANQLLLTGRNGSAADVASALRFAAQLLVLPEGGKIMPNATGGLSVRGADAVTLLIAMATSYRRFDDVSGDPEALVAQTLAAVRRKPFAQIADEASAAHHRLFRRVSLDLGTTPAASEPTDLRVQQSQARADPALAALYFAYARYLLIACSQPGGQPATLQGLWNDSLNPPWGSKYTVNINTEMNYWPAHSTNLSECAAPLATMIRELALTGTRTARDMYGARGWVCHHNTDGWRATAPIDGARWGMWPTGGAWLCTHLWEQYDYTRDRAFLASAYPLMAGASRFFLDTLMPDPRTGHLVTNPSISPENEHGHGGALCAGPTMDMAILRDLFAQTAEAATILGTDAELVTELQAASARLAPYQIGRQGQLQEWQADWDADATEQQHRHVSHLYGLYPSHQISVDATPDLAAAAKRTLEIRGDKATGWATAWRINLWARLRDGDRAHSILNFLLGPERTYPNLFDAHPPFQIDGNFGGAAGIVEMLLYSRGDTIELLPALPAAWPHGSVRGLRTRGACTVDIAWRNGLLTHAVLSPEHSGSRLLRYGRTERTLPLIAGRSLRIEGAALTAG
ncbi:glycoside hydrolase family 95 protein [Sphingomonas sp. RS6]